MTTPRISILLPPSEGKAEGGRRPAWRTTSGRFGRALGSPRAEVVAALADAQGGDAKLLGVSGVNLERARVANVNVTGSPTMPACQRYTGVVWDHIGFATLDEAARARADESIIIVSGLLGLAALDDPVPDYKLKMGGSLPGVGRLSSFWREPLSRALNQRIADTWVIDLLPIEHRAAFEPEPDRYRGLFRVSFVETSGKVAGHDAKAAKGMLVRHLLQSKASPAKALASWKHPRFNIDY